MAPDSDDQRVDELYRLIAAPQCPSHTLPELQEALEAKWEVALKSTDLNGHRFLDVLGAATLVRHCANSWDHIADIYASLQPPLSTLRQTFDAKTSAVLNFRIVPPKQRLKHIVHRAISEDEMLRRAQSDRVSRLSPWLTLKVQHALTQFCVLKELESLWPHLPSLSRRLYIDAGRTVGATTRGLTTLLRLECNFALGDVHTYPVDSAEATSPVSIGSSMSDLERHSRYC